MCHPALSQYAARVQRFDFGDRVTVRHTERTQELGIVGWHGEIVGKSYEDDAPDDILGYAVAMDEGDGLVWSVELADVEPET
jgi:hypothetical protein